MLLSICLLIAIALMIFVVAPLLSPAGVGTGTLPVDITPLGDLKRRRLVLYENLEDLEFEFKSGKISREDYQALRTDYTSEAVQLMAASQALELPARDEALIEKEIAARRARRRAERPEEYVCPKCGFENPLPVKFCGECGARVAPAKPRA
jgi:hypothetical protein